jgi:hypothetical protein
MMQQTLQIFDYLATQKDAVLSYQASNMVFAVHSNTSYLSKQKAQSWVGGHFFLSRIPPSHQTMGGTELSTYHQEHHVSKLNYADY